jgi:hypothetical protein
MRVIKYGINVFIIWVAISLYNSHVISLCRDYVFDDEIFEIAQFSIEYPLSSVVLIEGRESMQDNSCLCPKSPINERHVEAFKISSFTFISS